jgi:hypothetical protein
METSVSEPLRTMPYTVTPEELRTLLSLLAKIRGLVWPGMDLPAAHQATEHILEAQELVHLIKERGEQQVG